MIIYKKYELFGVNSVVLEYTEHELKIVPSFDKKEPLYCLFY